MRCPPFGVPGIVHEDQVHGRRPQGPVEYSDDAVRLAEMRAVAAIWADRLEERRPEEGASGPTEAVASFPLKEGALTSFKQLAYSRPHLRVLEGSTLV